MDRLLEGYRRFRAKGWQENEQTFKTLAENGQSPKALVVACVDSRVDPAMIFDISPGEILTVRNVANLVPPYAPDIAYHSTSAALEFGVKVLEVQDIIVFGHALCGGIRVLFDGTPDNAQDFIGQWMKIAEHARLHAQSCASSEDRLRLCEEEAIKVSLANLMTFPWIAERVASGKLALHGAWFDIGTGALMMLEPDGSFQAVE